MIVNVTEEDIEKAKEDEGEGGVLSFCCPVSQALTRQYPLEEGWDWRTSGPGVQEYGKPGGFDEIRKMYAVPTEVWHKIQEYDSTRVMNPMSFEIHGT